MSGEVRYAGGLSELTISAFADTCPEHVAQLVENDTGAFSASLLQLGVRRIMLVNDGHCRGRMNSGLAHEIAHVLLGHPPMEIFEHTGHRNFDQDMEEQANCLAAHVTIPDEATFRIVWSAISTRCATATGLAGRCCNTA